MTKRLHLSTFVDAAGKRPTWPSRWLGSAVCFAAVLLTACGGGSNTASSAGTPNPPAAAVARAPVLELGSAATATVGVAGGSVMAKARSGITYTLEIPAGALTADTAITLTPILDMGSAPLAASILGAVQMEPSGLKFRIPASLRIGAAPALPASQTLVGFSTANDGSAFRLNLARPDGASWLVNVTHFSTGGAAGATPAELPLVPLAPALIDADDAVAQLAELTARNAGLVDIVAVFHQWYLEIVNPALAQADGATDTAFLLDAVLAYKEWSNAMDYVADRNALALALATDLGESAPIATRVFKAFINGNLVDCANTSNVQSSLSSLSLASTVQGIAQSVGLAGPGSGLERAAFLAQVNNCLRVVIDPITLPAPNVGSGQSLNAQAKIVFINSPNPQGSAFEFTVTPTNASMAAPKGFSDAAGNYTSVYVPSDSLLSMEVKACLVLNTLKTAASDICVTQFVASEPARIFSGTVSMTLTAVPATGSATATVFVRVLISDSAVKGQVISASGTYFTDRNSTVLCQEIVGRTRNLYSSTTGTITGGVYAAGSNSSGTTASIRFLGTGTTTSEVDQDPGDTCNIVTVVDPPTTGNTGTLVSKGALLFDGGRLASINFAGTTTNKFTTTLIQEGVLLPEN